MAADEWSGARICRGNQEVEGAYRFFLILPYAHVQSACSVERVDAALATLLPLVPGVAYFRFCPEDVRCGIELDEIDPEQWALLEVSHSCVSARLQCRSVQQPAIFVLCLQP